MHCGGSSTHWRRAGPCRNERILSSGTSIGPGKLAKRGEEVWLREHSSKSAEAEKEVSRTLSGRLSRIGGYGEFAVMERSQGKEGEPGHELHASRSDDGAAYLAGPGSLPGQRWQANRTGLARAGRPAPMDSIVRAARMVCRLDETHVEMVGAGGRYVDCGVCAESKNARGNDRMEASRQ